MRRFPSGQRSNFLNRFFAKDLDRFFDRVRRTVRTFTDQCTERVRERDDLGRIINHRSEKAVRIALTTGLFVMLIDDVTNFVLDVGVGFEHFHPVLRMHFHFTAFFFFKRSSDCLREFLKYVLIRRRGDILQDQRARACGVFNLPNTFAINILKIETAME